MCPGITAFCFSHLFYRINCQILITNKHRCIKIIINLFILEEVFVKTWCQWQASSLHPKYHSHLNVPAVYYLKTLVYIAKTLHPLHLNQVIMCH